MVAEINVLSAGAVAPGLRKISEQFQGETEQRIHLIFATAPVVLERVNAGAVVDIVIAPAAVLDDLAGSGKISGDRRILLGLVGVGVMVRKGAAYPAIATLGELKQALQAASSVVFNRASTGTYLENLFQRLGIAAELEPKSIRYPDFAAVRDHISRGRNGEIGFGATTVIIENLNKGIGFVGALPVEVQNYTGYEAAVVQNGPVSPVAREFIKYLESPSARSALAQSGIV